LRADFIASHGHTIFHQPQKGFTYQLGSGQALQTSSGLPVVYDFRSLDVLLGGQGAPLVPIGDRHLFGDFDVCLNLGGIANLSLERGKDRIAFDICFCNSGSNLLIAEIGKSFDDKGQRAATGEVNSKLLNQLQKLYGKLRAKRPSLGRELFEASFKPLLENSGISLEDKLATWTESAAIEIITSLPADKKVFVLCTGGGAFNSFLMSRILHHASDNVSLIIPSDEVVKFKEALVFAFLGVLRVRGEVNCLKSVTGARTNSSSGLLVGL
jgi:anhydro-N-acetylmuramic acid kinase